MGDDRVCTICNGLWDNCKCGVDKKVEDWEPPELEVGTKSDSGKVPLDLLPFEAVLEVSRIMAFGAKKYSPRDWENGMEWGRLLAACLRHLFAWANHEDKDPESGHSHLAHAACCVLFLLDYEIRGIGKDDRRYVGGIGGKLESEKCDHEHDGFVYTSCPPKFRCKKCGEFYLCNEVDR